MPGRSSTGLFTPETGVATGLTFCPEVLGGVFLVNAVMLLCFRISPKRLQLLVLPYSSAKLHSCLNEHDLYQRRQRLEGASPR